MAGVFPSCPFIVPPSLVVIIHQLFDKILPIQLTTFPKPNHVTFAFIFYCTHPRPPLPRLKRALTSHVVKPRDHLAVIVLTSWLLWSWSFFPAFNTRKTIVPCENFHGKTTILRGLRKGLLWRTVFYYLYLLLLPVSTNIFGRFADFIIC